MLEPVKLSIESFLHQCRGYKGAVECFQDLFAREESWGAEVAKDKWNPADFDQIRAILSEWFA